LECINPAARNISKLQWPLLGPAQPGGDAPCYRDGLAAREDRMARGCHAGPTRGLAPLEWETPDPTGPTRAGRKGRINQ